MRVLGLMSGTSADGVDAVLAEFGGRPQQPRWRMLASAALPYPADLQRRLVALGQGQPHAAAELLELAETVSSLKLQSGATPAELSAVGQLVMLTQRIGKSANEFLTLEGVSPEAVFLLGKDLNSFREIADGLLRGNAELRLPGTKDAATRERLEQLISQYEIGRAHV